MQNTSFDEDFGVNAVELVAYDGTVLRRVKVDTSGNLVTSGGSSGADGAILDGVDTAIKATVKDLTNSNPLSTQIVDANGDAITSFGGGTQYTEDAAAAADPVGNMLITRRKDTLSATEVSADGDNIALNATNKGQLHVKLADTVTVDPSGVTSPVSLASVPSHAVTNAGTFATQATLAAETTKVIGVTRSADGAGNLLTSTSNALDINIKSGNLTTLPVTNAGTFAVQGTLSAETTKVIGTINLAAAQTLATVTTVGAVTAITNALPTGTNTIGTVNNAPLATVTGLTKYRGTAVSNTAIAVKASAGRLYNYHIYNAGTLDTFLQFYDVAQGSVTVGTTVPDKTFWVPAGGALDGGLVYSAAFASAISIAATTTVTGGTAPATALLVNLDYI